MSKAAKHIEIEKQFLPKLRFKEFDDTWSFKKLGKICKMSAGNFVGASEIFKNENKGLFPCYGGNGLRGYTRTFNREGKYSLIGRQGALCGNVTLAEGSFHATEHAVVVSLNQGFDSNWIFYLLYQSNLNQYSTGLAQPGLAVKNLETVNVSIPPSLTEQQKIASFLTAVDEKIQQLTKKKELLAQYKKGVMQQLFSGKLRFKDENGNAYPDWEESVMQDVFERVKEKNKENNLNVLTISAQKGLINQRDYFNRSVSAKDITGYYLLENGDFAYNKSYSKGYPMGAIKRLDVYDKGVVSTLYICFRIRENDDSTFYKEFLDHGGINRELHKIAQEGARNHGLLNMSVIEFFRDMKIPRPSIEEQKVIGKFLEDLSSKIELANKELTQTQTFKKGLLQQLFV